MRARQVDSCYTSHTSTCGTALRTSLDRGWVSTALAIAIQLYSAIQRYTLYSAIQRYTLYSYTALYTIYTTSTTPLWTAHSRALIDAHLLKALVLKLDYNDECTVLARAKFNEAISTTP